MNGFIQGRQLKGKVQKETLFKIENDTTDFRKLVFLTLKKGT